MSIHPFDAWLIGVLSTFVLLFVGAYCRTDEFGFLPGAIVSGGALVGAVDIATLLWPYRR